MCSICFSHRRHGMVAGNQSIVTVQISPRRRLDVTASKVEIGGFNEIKVKKSSTGNVAFMRRRHDWQATNKNINRTFQNIIFINHCRR